MKKVHSTSDTDGLCSQERPRFLKPVMSIMGMPSPMETKKMCWKSDLN